MAIDVGQPAPDFDLKNTAGEPVTLSAFRGKPVLLVANKVDTSRSEPNVAEFSALGFDQVFPVSAIHGEGIVELMTSATERASPI